MHYKILKLDFVLLMLGLLPSIHCTVAHYIAAHATATNTATSVLQLPLKLLHHAAHSTDTANCCTTTQLLRSKQLKDSAQLFDRQVKLPSTTEAPWMLNHVVPLETLSCCNTALQKPSFSALLSPRCCCLCITLLTLQLPLALQCGHLQPSLDSSR